MTIEAHRAAAPDGGPRVQAGVRPGPDAVAPTVASREAGPCLRIAMLGTRGVPAAYGGFETAVEEVGQRLASRGHEVTVYCRATPGGPAPRDEHLGMRLVHLPALHRKSLETLTHTGLAVAHLLKQPQRPDVALLFNAANAPLLPALRAGGVPVATHVDGLEWKRAKWGPAGKRFYRRAEELAVRWSDALIADAQGIAEYYRSEFDAPTELLTYGAPIQVEPASDRLAEVGVTPGRFHLVVARFEPENHVDLAVAGYVRSRAQHPLLVVGSAPYADAYTARVSRCAAGDPRVRLLGGVYDQGLLDQLYAHAHTYLHGHSVGGTNPSLLRAMGAATDVLAWDVSFNRDVLGTRAGCWSDVGELAALLEASEAEPLKTVARGWELQARARLRYRWDDVATGYESLCLRLAHATSAPRRPSGRRLLVRP